MSKLPRTRVGEKARRVQLLHLAAVTALSLPFVGFAPDQEGLPLPDLIVVQVPVSAAPASLDQGSLSTALDRYVDGARIVRVGAYENGAVVLTPEFTGACDPDISFDGETIVFAGKRDSDAAWQIWTMNADGSGKTQITRGPGQHIAPVFAGARFYLDDPQPTPQIIFTADEQASGTFALYGTDVEGTSLHRLTFNLQSDFSPALLPTGRIVFSSWQRYGDPWGPDGHLALLSVNIDGTDLMPFYGNHEAPDYKNMAAVSPGGDRVYFVESDQLPWLGGGELAYVSWRRPLHSYRKLDGEPGGSGLFHSPTPLPYGGLLASFRTDAPESTFAVYRLDPESGRRVEKVYEEADWHSIDTQLLKERPPVKGRSNWLRPGSTTGVFYCLDCYRTNLGDGNDRSSVAAPGTIRHVRVIEGRPRRILGIAPVEEDGSFQIRVPAETPITFQLLDEDYLALRTQRAWTWVMGNENRGCIGCHEDPEMSPPNRMVSAISRPPVDLVLPPARRRTVDFRHQIAPIISTSCATSGCHVSGGASPALGEPEITQSESAMREVYSSLVMPSGGRPGGPYVVPGSARSSPLIRRLMGGDTPSGRTGEGVHDVLERPEMILFIEWIDLGAEWDSAPTDDGGAP